MTTTAVTVPGGRLHVVDDGDPGHPPVVLLHAGIADLRAWDEMVGPLVNAGYRVVRYDSRGFGASTTDDVEFSNRADVVAVLDGLGIGRAALIGNSRGGQIAFDSAIEFPERVVAVIGVGAGLGGFEGQSTPEEIALFDEMEALEQAPMPDPDAIADIDVRVWVDGPGQPPTRVPTAIRDKVRAMDAPQYAPGHVSGRPVPLDPPAAARLADLRCPVLAVAGELDVSDVAQTARHLEANAPDARAVIVPGVAHMVGMEIPDELAALIVEFL
ncbi:MAG TPA: alpha/beta hydrolase, partial [Methylomirabilota bacterium]|nr:alpha/beta hydrolase [Methylomirabilota bacterium]